jgi:hypothetical protein
MHSAIPNLGKITITDISDISKRGYEKILEYDGVLIYHKFSHGKRCYRMALPKETYEDKLEMLKNIIGPLSLILDRITSEKDKSHTVRMCGMGSGEPIIPLEDGDERF